MMPVSLGLSPWETCMASAVRKCAWPPSCVMPASNEFRVRVDLSKNIRKTVRSGRWRWGVRLLKFRFRSAETSSMTSSSASVHSWVLIQSRPWNSAVLVSICDLTATIDDLLYPRRIHEVHAAGVADGFGEKLEFEIREHVEDARFGRDAFSRGPMHRPIVAQPDLDFDGFGLQVGPIGRRVQVQRVLLPRDHAIDGRFTGLPVDKEPVRAGVRAIRFQAAEESRLLPLRAAFFGAE